MAKFISTVPGTVVEEIPKSKFFISYSFAEGTYVINYNIPGKDMIPMWRCANKTLAELDFYILDETKCEDGGFVTFMCYDQFEDIYTYGRFENMAKAKEWLENPKRLY